MENFSSEPEVVDALKNGRTVDAIKLLRKSRGVGLKEAKDLVDRYVEEHGLAEIQSKGSGSLQGLIFIIALAVVGYFFFKNYL